MQRAPVDDDFSAADAEETAEIDYRRAHHAGSVHDHVDDATHVLVGGAAHVATKDAVRFAGADHGDRRRWRRLLCGFRGHRTLGLRRGIVLRPNRRRRREDRADQDNQNSRAHLDFLRFRRTKRDASMRQDDRHLDLAARTQHLERYFFAMTADSQVHT